MLRSQLIIEPPRPVSGSDRKVGSYTPTESLCEVSSSLEKSVNITASGLNKFKRDHTRESEVRALPVISHRKSRCGDRLQGTASDGYYEIVRSGQISEIDPIESIIGRNRGLRRQFRAEAVLNVA
jgi:hypothetical protein